MFEDIRQAIMAAPRDRLPIVAALVWRALGEGRVSEAEAETLSALVEAHRVQEPVFARGGEPRTGAAPLGRRSSLFPPRRPQRAPDRAASIERRRRLAASGPLPPALASRFTTSELAVLRIVADEAMKHGACRLYLDAIAARAGVSRSTVKNTLRQARLLGLLVVQERPQRGARSLSNIVSVVDKGWLAWLQRGPRIGGRKIAPTDTQIPNPGKTWTVIALRGRVAAPILPERRASRAAGA